jgi:hypothetical protein
MKKVLARCISDSLRRKSFRSGTFVIGHGWQRRTVLSHRAGALSYHQHRRTVVIGPALLGEQSCRPATQAQVCGRATLFGKQCAGQGRPAPHGFRSPWRVYHEIPSCEEVRRVAARGRQVDARTEQQGRGRKSGASHRFHWAPAHFIGPRVSLRMHPPIFEARRRPTC